jgi:hypothetical protein
MFLPVWIGDKGTVTKNQWLQLDPKCGCTASWSSKRYGELRTCCAMLRNLILTDKRFAAAHAQDEAASATSATVPANGMGST